MNAKYFIDTNIFVYHFDRENEEKQKTAHKIIKQSLEKKNTAISWQVIQEFLNVFWKRFVEKLSIRDLDDYTHSALLPLWKVHPTPDIYLKANEFRDRYDYSFYDSLIIAAALDIGAKELITEDMQHGQKIGSLKIVNPFV